MLRCWHGWPFRKVTLRNDERRVESVWCSHCNKMYQGSAWFADCCWNVFNNAYEDVSILNGGMYCMLCEDCYVHFRRGRTQLFKVDYCADFQFYDNYGKLAEKSDSEDD